MEVVSLVPQLGEKPVHPTLEHPVSDESARTEMEKFIDDEADERASMYGRER